jgi:acyl-CoA synthetase (AMP-forming)/AMP-acid ligase II
MRSETFVALLRERAERHPGRRACAYLGDGERITEALAYGELDADARAVADMVSRRLAPGARALIACEPGVSFVRTFLGCLYAGVVAVPVVPPAPPRPDLAAMRVRGILADCGAEAVLTTRAIQAMSGAAQAFGATPALLVDGPLVGEPDSWRDPGLRPDTLAFLQYTSGSTGNPRGVMVTHANLLANQRAITVALGVPSEVCYVNWLPTYHDMGLIGMVLHPLYGGSTVYLMSPLHFMQQPARWLRAVSRYRAHVSGGPNFAYELTARRAGALDLGELDLSCWRIAYCGAEPIRAATVRRFGETFGAAGFDPACLVGCYGLAESTLLVSGAQAADPKEVTVDQAALEHGEVIVARRYESGTVTLASSGRACGQYDVRIVDPRNAEPCPGGRVGEVWIAGQSVAAGYWHRPRETHETFDAALPGTDRRYLRTGDLGFLHDGQLYLTGRIKDLLIVRGRNVHPHDVEDAAQRAHQLCRPGGGAAFATEDGRVVLVQETTASDPAELVEVAAAARQAVLEAQQIRLDELMLVAPRQVPKTSSGKVRRSACRTMALAGELAPLYRDSDRTLSASAIDAAEV